MRRTGHTLTVGFLVLAGAGVFTLSGTGIAQAKPAALPAACTGLLALEKSFVATLNTNKKKYEADPAEYIAAVDNYGKQLLKVTSSGSPALQSAAKTYVTDYEAMVVASSINASRLSADSSRMAVLACVPKGAPRTGGGSTAGLQASALVGTGGAATLAGVVVIGLSLRHRTRNSADKG
jgi:hypothetical protein